MPKIEHMDLSCRVYETLKAMILSGKLVPGQKIVQMKLAEEIGVSRTPLLKALNKLEHEFLVESVPRRGMLVKKMSLEEIIDAFDCREGLEGIAARLVAQHITEKQLNRLKDLFLPFKESPGRIVEKKYVQADQKFHRLLIDYSDNRIIRRIEMLGNVHLICYNRGLIRSPHETLPEHFGIIEAIEQGDGDLAEQRLKSHLHRSRNVVAESLIAGHRSAG
ncbi:MAG: GntR family transcriptional regulator [Planctomycetes bacterium]|nr:GntR family transcriptional regulator [Planctomycetota bacterium]